jgi:hypothetical protein
MFKILRAAALAAALFGVGAGSAVADECSEMVGNLKKLIDGIEPDKAKSEPAKCAAYGEGLGLMRTFRVVSDECLPEGDKRIQTLADLDRTVRRLQTEVDKMCRR